MKKFTAFVCLMGLIYTSAISQPKKFISVKGKEIVDINNKPFLIKGTNLGNWLIPEGYMFKFKDISSPKLINEAFNELIGPEETKAFWTKYLDNYITEGDIHYLKSIGCNSIRVPFNYRLFTNETYLGTTDANRGFRILDRLIGWCKKENLYVILDMHAAPGGQTGDNIDDGDGYPFLFTSAASRKLTVDIWTKIAARYYNEPIVLGYDLLNEPIAHYFNTAEINPYLEPVYKEIVAGIRTVDKNHLVFLGGAQWDSNFKVFGKPFDSKAVYTFHKYWTASTQDVIQDYLDFRDKYNVPVYCGETGENKNDWDEAFRKMLEKNNVGWHFWPYKKMDAESSFMTFNKPDGYDTIVEYTEKKRESFEDIRKAAPADRAAIKKALYDMIENSKFANARPNKAYSDALGLK
ncbi:glycoside hydrolase family 5 protein [Mucilaginibacter jinjuensis]|uniref:Cellulase family glycosylhydrolase n=1 Tax=Mucilaginibacter jinjuensis TaxID=1176721 RepID=A0ABY7TCA5_9SPHI|nr:cellulase family glycosylhydrolase [Mucilaginibacter jinjuensis]WCT13705.1 cellulase family glycosylhydrolase [Mucilaginibacter jinjuensis]